MHRSRHLLMVFGAATATVGILWIVFPFAVVVLGYAAVYALVPFGLLSTVQRVRARRPSTPVGD
ncbi:MAG TPA: hypothetical protein VGB52_09470 [Actinomycetota bacterium]